MSQLALPLLNFSARAAELGLDGSGKVPAAEAQAKFAALRESHEFLKDENVKQVLEASFGMQAYFSRIFFELVWGS